MCSTRILPPPGRFAGFSYRCACEAPRTYLIIWGALLLIGRNLMNALALVLSLATAVGPNDLDLPRTMSLDEFRFTAFEPAPAAPPEMGLFAQLHIGLA